MSRDTTRHDTTFHDISLHFTSLHFTSLHLIVDGLVRSFAIQSAFERYTRLRCVASRSVALCMRISYIHTYVHVIGLVSSSFISFPFVSSRLLQYDTIYNTIYNEYSRAIVRRVSVSVSEQEQTTPQWTTVAVPVRVTHYRYYSWHSTIRFCVHVRLQKPASNSGTTQSW